MLKWIVIICCFLGSCEVLDDENFCEVDGKKYEVGETFPEDCNTCFCGEDGNVGCTEMACEVEEMPKDSSTSEGDYCEKGDTKLEVGESYFDGCNDCACTEGGLLMCTLQYCEEEKSVN